MPRRLIRILVLAAIIAAPLAVVLARYKPVLMGLRDFDPGRAKAFASVIPGFPRERVTELMGEPDATSELLDLEGYDCPDSACDEADASGADYYLYWYQGESAMYVVGIAERDGMVVKLVAAKAEAEPGPAGETPE